MFHKGVTKFYIISWLGINLIENEEIYMFDFDNIEFRESLLPEGWASNSVNLETDDFSKVLRTYFKMRSEKGLKKFNHDKFIQKYPEYLF